MDDLTKKIWMGIWMHSGNEGESIELGLKEIEKAYSSKGRYYHNMDHIANLLKLSLDYSNSIDDIGTLQLAVFYHDIVYLAKKKDNEEKSALFAEKSLKTLNYNENRIEKCKQFILATKTHNNVLNNNDLDYLLDFDLEILSAPWQGYFTYTKQVRKEYSFYPDIIYKPGRKKVLEHFLRMSDIYKTIEFREKYEKAARENLTRELEML
jgi:predicted metal-dependent HD superfamily phosphohydrolase